MPLRTAHSIAGLGSVYVHSLLGTVAGFAGIALVSGDSPGAHSVLVVIH